MSKLADARWAVAVVVTAIIAVSAKQALAIANHGITGWLEGAGAFQSEWEVRAVIGLLLVGVPALVLITFVRVGESGHTRLQEWRWSRAARRPRQP